jgi:PEP-CTERM motif-containing protein
MRSFMTQTLLKRAAFVLPVTLVSLFASANAYGSTIILDSTLTNPSFEANPDKTNCPTGWTCGGTLGNPGFATSYDVTSAQYTAGADGIAGVVPFGLAAATMPFPVEGSGSIMQTGLGSYVTGNTYTVDLWIGTPMTLPNDNTTAVAPVGTITAYFLGNGGQVAVEPLTASAVGQWVFSPVSFTATAAQNGQTIGFEIFVDSSPVGGGSGNNRIADFDIGTVPEPASFALLGLGLLGMGIARKRLRS